MSYLEIPVIRPQIPYDVAIRPQIPYDVALDILENFRGDKRMLSKCALVCKIWSAAARPHQYYYLSISSQNRLLQLLHRLDTHPEIGPWVMHLILHGDLCDKDYVLGRTLTRLHKLTFLVKDQPVLPHFVVNIPALFHQNGYLPALREVNIRGTQGSSKLNRAAFYDMLHCFPRVHRLSIEHVDFLHVGENNVQLKPLPTPFTLSQLHVLGSTSSSADVCNQLLAALDYNTLEIMRLGSLKMINDTLDTFFSNLAGSTNRANLTIHLSHNMNSWSGIYIRRLPRDWFIVVTLHHSDLALRILSNLRHNHRVVAMFISTQVPVMSTTTYWSSLDDFIATRLPKCGLVNIRPERCYDFVTEKLEEQTTRLLFPQCVRKRLVQLKTSNGLICLS